MSEGKQRFYIYDRREVFILFALAIVIAIFFFTLGVHLAKDSLSYKGGEQKGLMGGVDTAKDELPSNLEFLEQKKSLGNAAEEALNQELQAEVATLGVRLEQPRQIRLPDRTIKEKQRKKKKKEAPSKATAEAPVDAKAEAEAEKIASDLTKKEMNAAGMMVDSPDGKYTLQVASYPKLSDAEDRISKLRKSGMEPFIRRANIRGKGQWYRVYVGGFETKKKAQVQGRAFVKDRVIRSFIVARMP